MKEQTISENSLLGKKISKATADERKKIWFLLFEKIQKKLTYKIVINDNYVVAKDNKDNTLARMTFNVFNDGGEQILEVEHKRILNKEVKLGTLMILQVLINNPAVSIITVILSENNASIYRAAREKGVSHFDASKFTSIYQEFSVCGFTEIVSNKSLKQTEISLPRITLKLAQ